MSGIFLALIGGLILGANLRVKPADIDLHKENLKLRKENEVLWDRLRATGKIDQF